MFEYLEFIANWLQNGIYEFFTELVAYLFSTAMLLYFKAAVAGIDFAWDIAKSVINNIGLSSKMASAWAVLPADTMAAAQLFKVPESINLILTAGVTRLVMSFLPGL